MRFSNRRDIRNVLRFGRRLHVRLGRILIAPAGTDRGRILFIVSSAVAKKSARRNRIKRQLDEWARKKTPGCLSRHHIVVLVSREAATCSGKDLMNLAEELCRRLNALSL